MISPEPNLIKVFSYRFLDIHCYSISLTFDTINNIGYLQRFIHTGFCGGFFRRGRFIGKALDFLFF